MIRGNDPDQDWERFGRDDPYFGVYAADRFRAERLTPEARAEFFASGEAHVEAVWQAVRAHLDPAFAPSSALDFGCGVGRLLIPLAARVERVTGVDVSESMLREAERNCAERGLAAVRLIHGDDALSRIEGSFDLVHSFIVLQHIPPARGEALFAALVDRVAAGGVGVLHVTFANELGVRERCVRWARAALPIVNRLWNIRHGMPADTPWMQMNRYDLNRLMQILQDADAHDGHVRFTNHFGHRGVVLLFRKQRRPSFGDAS